jgi:hypothetical protein
MFKRSTTGLDRDKTDLSRTSSTAWLIDPSHYSNPLVKRIENRMASAMNVPAINQEGFQVLEYQLSEYYRVCGDTSVALTFAVFCVGVFYATHTPSLGIQMHPDFLRVDGFHTSALERSCQKQ